MDDAMTATRSYDAAPAARLEMHWVPTTDEHGRSHLEAVWVEEAPAAPSHHHHAA